MLFLSPLAPLDHLNNTTLSSIFFLADWLCVMAKRPIVRRRRRNVGEAAVPRHMGELGGPSAQPFRHLLFFPRCHGRDEVSGLLT